jgi:c(7)-type cytochrome triheme protein
MLVPNLVSIVKNGSNMMKITLLLLCTLLILSCSQKTLSLLFDIPDKDPNEISSVEGVSLDAKSDSVVPTLVYSGNPADSEEDRPPVENTLIWEEALEFLPADEAGAVNWMAALNDGVIKPRAADPADRQAEFFKLDFNLKGPNKMFDAWFPHSSHTAWLGCKNCHGNIFPYRNNEITMAAINQGQYCGTCHGSVAFAATECKRCHLAMP